MTVGNWIIILLIVIMVLFVCFVTMTACFMAISLNKAIKYLLNEEELRWNELENLKK